MSIQQDVLDTIGPEGIETNRLREAMGSVRGQELDVTVNALLRARRIQIAFGRYEVMPSTRPVGVLPGRPVAPAPVVRVELTPTAQEEAAASLRPPAVRRVCEDCKAEKDLETEFSRNRHGPMRICKICQGKRISAAANHQVGGQIATQPVAPPVIKEHIQVAKSVEEDAPKQPVIADRVFETVRARRESIQQQLKSLAEELSACDQFIAIYDKYAEGATNTNG